MLTRAYTTFTKKCGQRASPLFTVALLAVFCAGGFSRVYSAAECLLWVSQHGLRLAECWRSPLWGAQTAVRYTHLSARLCALDRITNTYTNPAFERCSGIGSGRVPKRCAHRRSQAENYPITREQIDDILQYLEQGVLGRKTADGSTLPSLDRVLRRASSQAGHVAALRLLDMAALRLLVAVGALATAHGALELTEDNWDSALAGKSAFVKFLAPW